MDVARGGKIKMVCLGGKIRIADGMNGRGVPVTVELSAVEDGSRDASTSILVFVIAALR